MHHTDSFALLIPIEFGEWEVVTETQRQRSTGISPGILLCRLEEASSSMKAHPLPESPVSLGSAEGSLLLPFWTRGGIAYPSPDTSSPLFS